MECQHDCDGDHYQDWCEIQDCAATGQICQIGACTGSCVSSCFTGPGCRSSLANGHTTAGNCCGSGSCYICDSGYTWNGSVCSASCADTCSSLGYNCGTATICGASTNCGNCASPQICCLNHCQAPVCINNASCNDGNGCTSDMCNNANTCTASCSHANITTCINNDSCCPASCTSANDNDCTVTLDTTPPVINSFNAIVNTNSINISWSVQDSGGSHLDRIEIWRAPDSSGVPGSWSEVASIRRTITSQNLDSYTNNVVDTPGNGSWWYGIHVVDQAGNLVTESNPINRVINNAAVCVSDGCNSNCPVNCTITQDPDCGCQNSNSCCGVSCTNINDNDCLAPIDNVTPTVSLLTASVVGNTVNISYTVTDSGGSYLARAEVWRAPDNAGVPGVWSEVTSLRQTISSQLNYFSTSLADSPASGSWWYGLHVIDGAGNIGYEKNSPQITIAAACAPTCTTGPGCRVSLINATVTNGNCCGNGSCYTCNTGYTWDGSICTASMLTCTPDGCNGNCPVGCTIIRDPDCGCQNGNNCCGVSCNSTNDTDCAAACVTTCATGPGCQTSLTNASIVVGTCCSGSCFACNTGFVWNGSSCVVAPTCSPDGCNGNCPVGCTASQDLDCSVGGCCGDNLCITPDTNMNCPTDCTATSLDFNISSPTKTQFVTNGSIYFSINVIGGTFPYTYTLASNLDGQLYQSTNKDFSIGTNNLTLGRHSMTLAIKDSSGKEVSKQIMIEIINFSTLLTLINTPANSQQFTQGASISFNSYVAGGSFPYTYQWISNRDGVIGNQSVFSKNDLSTGNHKINLIVTDGSGVISSSSVDIEVTSGLILNFNNPKMYSYYEQGANITFYVSSAGGTSPYTYQWSSDKDGNFSTAQSLTKSNLSLGKHTITATVTDSAGQTVSKSAIIEVIPPTCIDKDADGYGVATSLACKYKGLDCDDNNSSIHPSAAEDCTNSIDDDCNGSTTDCGATIQIIMPASDTTYIWGSSSTIQARISGGNINSAYIYVRDASEKNIASIYLYNDGAHNDGVANDDIFAGLYQAINAAGSYHIDAMYYYNSTQKYAEGLRKFDIIDAPVCTTITNNGNSSDKLDIVFVADRYNSTNIGSYESTVTAAVNRLITINPFNANVAKINFHRVNAYINSNCQTISSTHVPSGPNDMACSSLAYIVGAFCPNDEVVIMSNSNYRSFAYFGGYACVSALSSNPPGTTVHELGHSFASLADEYYPEDAQSAATSSVIASINCDVDSSCSKWNSVTGTGCFAGCYYRTYFYRSVNSGIMRTSGNNTDFGVLNVRHIQSIFNNYK